MNSKPENKNQKQDREANGEAVTQEAEVNRTSPINARNSPRTHQYSIYGLRIAGATAIYIGASNQPWNRSDSHYNELMAGTHFCQPLQEAFDRSDRGFPRLTIIQKFPAVYAEDVIERELAAMSGSGKLTETGICLTDSTAGASTSKTFHGVLVSDLYFLSAAITLSVGLPVHGQPGGGAGVPPTSP